MKIFLILVFIAQFKFIHAQLWENDFSNSSEWISTDLNAGTDQWTISNAAIGGNVDTINSASAGNGFAQFNSEVQCSANHQDVVLTYFQTIDISSNELSYLEFVQHYKRKKDTLYVEFSNDGLTWESIRVNQKYWFYQQTSNPDTVRVSIPSAIQSQPFYLRFKYSGECGFAWLIDDVKIFEKEQYAITVSEKLVQNEMSFEEIPVCQIDILQSKVHVTNFGFDTLFDVKVQIDKYKDGVFDFTFLEIIDTVLPESDTLFFTSVLDGSMVNTYDFYQFEFKIYSNDLDTLYRTDSVYISETVIKAFKGEDGNYFTTSNEDWGIGNMFIFTNEYCSTVPAVYIPDDPNALGQMIFIRFYKVVNGLYQYYTNSGDHQITNSDLGNWTFLIVEDPYAEFFAGDTSIIIVSTYGSTINFEYTSNITTSFTLSMDETISKIEEGRSVKISLNPYFGFDCNTCWESINENDYQEISVFPNPASDFISIESQTQLVEVRIFSLDGKLVYTASDLNVNDIDISMLNPGLYAVKAKDQTGNVLTGRFVKA